MLNAEPKEKTHVERIGSGQNRGLVQRTQIVSYSSQTKSAEGKSDRREASPHSL